MGSPVSARGALFAVVALSAVVWSAGACRDFPCSEVVLLRICCAVAIRGLVVAAAAAHAAPTQRRQRVPAATSEAGVGTRRSGALAKCLHTGMRSRTST